MAISQYLEPWFWTGKNGEIATLLSVARNDVPFVLVSFFPPWPNLCLTCSVSVLTLLSPTSRSVAPAVAKS